MRCESRSPGTPQRCSPSTQDPCLPWPKWGPWAKHHLHRRTNAELPDGAGHPEPLHSTTESEPRSILGYALAAKRPHAPHGVRATAAQGVGWPSTGQPSEPGNKDGEGGCRGQPRHPFPCGPCTALSSKLIRCPHRGVSYRCSRVPGVHPPSNDAGMPATAKAQPHPCAPPPSTPVTRVSQCRPTHLQQQEEEARGKEQDVHLDGHGEGVHDAAERPAVPEQARHRQVQEQHRDAVVKQPVGRVGPGTANDAPPGGGVEYIATIVT